MKKYILEFSYVMAIDLNDPKELTKLKKLLQEMREKEKTKEIRSKINLYELK